LILPFLTGFLFDVPLLNKVAISLVITVASYVAQSLIEALVKFWQAVAITAFIFLLVNKGFGGSTNQLWTAVPILVVWLLLLINSKSSNRKTVENYKATLMWPYLFIFGYLHKLAP